MCFPPFHVHWLQNVSSKVESIVMESLTILLKNAPIMPCSSPHHAPLQVRAQRLGPNVLLGSGLRLTKARLRKRTCSRRNSYFDPSVRSDCGSLMSICLAGISLAPGNPTGFLRIGEGFEGCPIRHKHTHTFTHSEVACQRGGTRGGSGCWCVCVVFRGNQVHASSEAPHSKQACSTQRGEKERRAGLAASTVQKDKCCTNC